MCQTCAAPDCALSQAYNHPDRKSFDVDIEQLRRAMKERRKMEIERRRLSQDMHDALRTSNEWESARRNGITTTQWKASRAETKVRDSDPMDGAQASTSTSTLASTA
ncbi:hypothetical protein BD626DRAFT_573865 [Schizophyllum amplum]|uniref:Uncharacterized protein n=1 Tax=Schizophyllum amplum TaxID=97359 RepID=A0A550BZW8_9AGAR|nr:hypothetical protein BD626DRAFT_573865 [Auriculariopsis ampla]